MRLHRTGNWESRKSRTIAVWVQLENALAGGPKKNAERKHSPVSFLSPAVKCTPFDFGHAPSPAVLHTKSLNKI